MPVKKIIKLDDFFYFYWVLYAVLQVYLILHTTIDCYDAFGNLCDARTIAGKFIGYAQFRLPLIPLLHAPLQKILDLLGSEGITRIVAPHFLQGAISAGCLVIFYRYLRLFFTYRWAQIGVLLFSLNRMTLHYFFSVLSDIPCTLCLLVYFYYSALRPPKTLLPFIALVACLLCRLNMLALPIILFILTVMQHAKKKSWLTIAIQTTGLMVAAYALFAITNIVLFHLVLKTDWSHSWSSIFEVFNDEFHANQAPESAAKYIVWLALSSGIAILPFCGTVLRWIRNPLGDKFSFHAIFFFYFFAVMGFFIGHKEARYLFPMLPSFYILAVLGLQRWYSWAQHSLSRRIALAAAVAISVGWGACDEISHFSDPIYRSSILLDSAKIIKSHLAGDSRIFWSGFSYSLVPVNYHFADDDFYYLYHAPSLASTAYLTGETVQYLERNILRDGDLLIEAPERPFLLKLPLPEKLNKINIFIFGFRKKNLLATLP